MAQRVTAGAVPRLALVVVLAGACGGSAVPSPLAAPAACRLITGEPQADTVVVGVSEPVDLTHAPVPLTEAERLVFAPFFETLVRLDCAGRTLPELAQRWSREEDDGRGWRFTLRDGARFWDGTPVTAVDIAAAWTGNPAVPADSVVALDPRTLRMVLLQPDTSVPRWLADPRLAIGRPAPPGGTPLGTGPYAVVSWTPGRIEARALAAPGHILTFRLSAGADPRDLLDQGVDVVITDDPAALAYAQNQDAFEVAPLPWAWTYVLAGPPADAPGAAGLAGEIAPEAVRGDVRPAAPPFWWTQAPRCPERRAGVGAVRPGVGRRIAYSPDDPVARDLAGRLVALAAAGRILPGVGPLAAVALGAGSGDEWGYVVAIPRQSYRACLDAPPGHIVPLLDARSAVVARWGRVSVDVEWDGLPRLVWP